MLQSSVSTVSSTVVVTRPAHATLAAITQAAALMAQADGTVDGAEQQALLRFLRGHDLLRYFGRRACLSAYHAALEHNAPEAEVLGSLGRQAGHVAAPLIASAAASIALADGDTHPAEVALLCRLAERLSVLGDCDDVATVLFSAQ